MTAPGPAANEFLDLMCDLAEGRLSPPQAARLEELLQSDPARRRQYVDFLLVVGGLHRIRGEGQGGKGVRGQGSGVSKSEIRDPTFDVGAAVQLPYQLREKSEVGSPEPLIAPIIIDTSAAGRSGGYFTPGGWPFSYAAATVITGLIILTAWVWKVSLDGGAGISSSVQVAGTDETPVPPAAPAPVAQITGMADCRWADPQDVPPATVRLGRRYELAAGLMEISYATGAKVILQGPCRYEVDSAAGGFLSLGKLTARVDSGQWSVASEKKPGVRGQESEHYPLSTNHYPLFAVRTPTAVVTDLGTEFGVEVDEQGRTESHVFVGKVMVVANGTEGDAAGTRTIGAGQTARCRQGERVEIVPASTAKPDRFVRSLQPQPQKIVERFSGPELGPALEQMPPGRYAIGDAAAVYRQPADTGGRQSRAYIRTAATDFCDCNFVCDVTIDVRFTGSELGRFDHQVFFGIGDGEPNHRNYDEMACGIWAAFVLDTGALQVRQSLPDEVAGSGGDSEPVAEFIPTATLAPGRHRLRMVKRDKWLQFLVDADPKGNFHTDFQTRWIDLPAVMPELNATNSRLVLGTGNCDTMSVRFEDFSIVYTKPPVVRQPDRGESDKPGHPGGATHASNDNLKPTSREGKQ